MLLLHECIQVFRLFVEDLELNHRFLPTSKKYFVNKLEGHMAFHKIYAENGKVIKKRSQKRNPLYPRKSRG